MFTLVKAIIAAVAAAAAYADAAVAAAVATAAAVSVSDRDTVLDALALSCAHLNNYTTLKYIIYIYIYIIIHNVSVVADNAIAVVVFYTINECNRSKNYTYNIIYI